MPTAHEKMADVLQRFKTGALPLSELLLHVEPILDEVAATPSRRAASRALVNAIEKARFTEVEPQLSERVAELLIRAMAELDPTGLP